MENSGGERESNCKNQKLNHRVVHHHHHHHHHHHRRRRQTIQSLPQDVILDIVSRLPIKSIIQLRYVSKTFYTFSHDPNLLTMTLSRQPPPLKQNLFLLFHCDYPLRNHLYFTDFPHRGQHDTHNLVLHKFQTPFSISIPEFHIVASCNGLICLVNSLHNHVVCVYNPFTRHYRELPRCVEFEHQIVTYGFGFHPITKEYKVVKISYYMNTYNNPSKRFIIRNGRGLRSEVQVFRLGDEQWRSIGEVGYKLDRKSSPALVNGRLHWINEYGMEKTSWDAKRIVCFDLSDEVFREVSPPESLGRACPVGYHLVALGGCLSIATPPVHVYKGLEVWVMKEYGVVDSWVKMFVVEPHYMAKEFESKGVELRKRSCLSGDRLRVRVLCVVENGEILIEYDGCALVAYDAENKVFKDLAFPGMPSMFHTILHVANL